jgi:Zn-dependent alcohol dehydrogenase
MASILKVNTLKHTNDTTAMTVDTSGNVTASGNVTTTGNTAVGGTLAVTGVHTVGNNAIHTSDGGAVTQNLVQGLAKCWIQFNGTGTIATQDSLNISSIADNATGHYQLNINNDMSNNDYSLTAGIGRINGSGSGVIMHHHIAVEAGLFNFYNQTTGTEDVTVICGTIHGDLA